MPLRWQKVKGSMSVKSAHMHLAMNKPPRVDSAYQFAQKFRVSEQTAKECLRANGYSYEEVPGGQAWIRHSTQLDDMEAKLDVLYSMMARILQVNSSTTGGSLSESLAAERLDKLAPANKANGRGTGLQPNSFHRPQGRNAYGAPASSDSV
jgi:hypothetical protein